MGFKNTNGTQNHYITDDVASLSQGYTLNTVIKRNIMNGPVLRVKILSTLHEKKFTLT